MLFDIQISALVQMFIELFYFLGCCLHFPLQSSSIDINTLKVFIVC